MGMLDKAEITRRICPVIFLLDTSGSMSGAPIGAVNAAIEGVLPELESMNNDNPDVEIMIAIMTFDSGVAWHTGTGGLVNPENFAWNDLNIGGSTSMGAAFKELNSILSVTSGFMKKASGSVAPVLFLLTDGEPTDDYQKGLQDLKKNNWYRVAARVAIGYGNSNDSVLKEFTGNSETVLHTDKPEELRKFIKFVSITSSMVTSTGKGATLLFDPYFTPDPCITEDPDDTTNAVAAAIKANQPTLLNNSDPNEIW